MVHHVRLLAKMGVNMIRTHANIAPREEGMKITDVHRAGLEQLWRYAAECKKNGIYLTISPYWYHHRMPASWEEALPGYKKGDMPTGSLFFNPVFQDAYKIWVKALYDEVNPHTGIKLKDDPTVAIIQVKNEDSLLFYTSQRLPREQTVILARQYHDWLVDKYGSIEQAYAAWDGTKINEGQGDAMGKLGDDPDGGVMGMYIIWQMTQPHAGGMDRRLSDQLHFMGWRQRQFYADMHDYYTETLGCRQLTNAMNWKGADKLTVDDVERWSYTACDVIAVNRYTGGSHIGQNNGYRIDPGHHIINRSIIRNPLQLPTNLKQITGHPFIITESSWVRPNLYQTEGPMMVAAYLSLTGVDSFYWFAHGERDWMQDPRRKFWHVRRGHDTGYALQKWTCATQPLQGMWPANALLYRKGYLQQGQPVVHEVRSLQALWDREAPIIAETETFDPNRDTRDLRQQSEGASTDVSRLAFLVGPVHVTFGGDPADTKVADLTPYIDGEAQVVRSNTGELELRWGEGLFVMNAPKAQGVSGFLKDAGGRFELADAVITSDNDYATIQLVAMDDQPLASSGRVLVQAGTTARLTGWATSDSTVKQGDRDVPARKIEFTGKPPYQVVHTRATVTLSNAGITKATRLNGAGYPVEDVPVRRSGDRVTVELPVNTMYLVLE
jgi:hypothetical protein